MNDDNVKKEYDCENCKYRIYDEYFCGCCMMHVLDEFEKIKHPERPPLKYENRPAQMERSRFS
jgi:hypothetical protein